MGEGIFPHNDMKRFVSYRSYLYALYGSVANDIMLA